MDFYYLPASAPCRSVIMAAKIIGVDLNKKLLDLKSGEHLKPEFLKINPQHTIPTLDDKGYHIWESRAIMTYLADQYAKDDSIYPKCPKKRAVVIQRLCFDMELYYAFGAYFYPQKMNNAPADPEKLKQFHAKLEFLNTFLEGNSYVAGDNLTLADLALIASISTFEISGIDFSSYANIKRWYENGKKVIPNYSENHDGCLAFKAYFEK